MSHLSEVTPQSIINDGLLVSRRKGHATGCTPAHRKEKEKEFPVSHIQHTVSHIQHKSQVILSHKYRFIVRLCVSVHRLPVFG